ncbi:winged helix-turn-helix domain-containing protein (plasmid) [Methanocaldococcus sp. 10A]
MFKRLFSGDNVKERIERLEHELKALKVEFYNHKQKEIEILNKLNMITKEIAELKNSIEDKKTSKDIVKMTIIELLKNGDLCATDIAKRIKGKSYSTIFKALKELEKEKIIMKYPKIENNKRKIYYKLL